MANARVAADSGARGRERQRIRARTGESVTAQSSCVSRMLSFVAANQGNWFAGTRAGGSGRAFAKRASHFRALACSWQPVATANRLKAIGRPVGRSGARGGPWRNRRTRRRLGGDAADDRGTAAEAPACPRQCRGVRGPTVVPSARPTARISPPTMTCFRSTRVGVTAWMAVLSTSPHELPLEEWPGPRRGMPALGSTDGWDSAPGPPESQGGVGAIQASRGKRDGNPTTWIRQGATPGS